MFSLFLGGGLSSSAIELAAILKACELCEFGNCPEGYSILIESDCSGDVREINGGGAVVSVRNLESILKIRELLRRNAPRLSSCYVPRSCNVTADILAKLGAISGLDQVVWQF